MTQSSFGLLKETARKPQPLPHVEGGCQVPEGIDLKKPKGKIKIVENNKYVPIRNDQTKVYGVRVLIGCKYKAEFKSPLSTAAGPLYEAKLKAFEARGEYRLGFEPEDGGVPKGGWPLSAFAAVTLIP